MNLTEIFDHAAKYAAEQKPNTGYTSRVIAAVREKCERGEYPDGTNIGVQIALQFDGRETPEDLTDIGIDEKRSPYGASYSMDGPMDCMDFVRNLCLLLFGVNPGDWTQGAYAKNKDKQVPWDERREMDLYLNKLGDRNTHATHAMLGIGKPKMLHTTSKKNPLRVESDTKYSASTRTGTGVFRILSDEQYNALIYRKETPVAPTEPPITKPAQPARKPTRNLSYKCYVNANGVSFRKSASTSATRLGKLNKGTAVTFLGVSGKWTHVRYFGQTGYIYSKYLVRGDYMRGEDVLAIQKALGFAEEDCDGVFGPQTAAAVAVCQAENGLVVDGIVGPKTWAKLIG